MVQKNMVQKNNVKKQKYQTNQQERSQNQKQKQNNRRDGNVRLNNRRNSKNEFQKKTSRYVHESRAARIITPKREESIDDIRMDIEKLEKDIQFEIKQIKSIKLGL